MIIVDEQLHDPDVMSAISAWYPGQVLPITALRPRTIIKDEAIPALLRGAAQPTFVTINITDFWELVQSHRSYCIIAVALPKERIPEIPDWLRRLLRLPEFKSKRARMGKIIRMSGSGIRYYESNRKVQLLSWPD